MRCTAFELALFAPLAVLVSAATATSVYWIATVENLPAYMIAALTFIAVFSPAAAY